MRHLYALFFLVGASAAHAQPTLDLKGIAIGDTEEKVAALGLQCRPASQEMALFADVSCSPPIRENSTIAGEAASYVAAELIDGKVVSVTVLFNPRSYDQIDAAVTAKYGPAPSDVASEIKTRGGVTYTNRVRTWRTGGSAALELKRYSGSVTTGSINLKADSYYPLVEQRQKAAGKKNAGDV